MSSDRGSPEDGASLPIVLLAVVILGGVVTMLFSTTVAEIRATAVQRDTESAIHAAEAAGDLVIAQLNENSDYTTGHVLDPTLSAAAQRTWAVDQFTAARSASPAPPTLVDTPRGEALGIRPKDAANAPLDVIFAVGEIAGPVAPELRVVRMGFDQGFYSPSNALLTGCGLTVNGGPEVTGVSGNVHSNCGLTISGSSATFTGTVTASGSPATGTYDTGSGTGTVTGGVAPQPVPSISARQLYDQQRLANPAAGWYDLCPDQRVHQQAAAGAVPCSGTALSAAGAEYRGWRFQAGEWRRSGQALDGVYYVFQKSVKMTGTGSGGPVAMTVIVEGVAGDGGTGNIDVGGNGQVTPYWQDLTFIADKDITMSGSSGGGGLGVSGFIGAHEQVNLGGNTALVGAVVAEDAPHTPGSPVSANGIGGSATLVYDGGLQVPLSSTIRVTAWNEL